MPVTGGDGDDLGHQADAAISTITALSTQARAARFLGEFISGSEPLSALRGTFGTHALEYVLYLANAIAVGGVVELPLRRRGFAAFVGKLPGGSHWSQHVRLVPR
jgi:hypothetical protein